MQPEAAVFDAGTTPRPEGELRELARMADALVDQLGETRHHYEQLRSDLDGAGARARTHDAPSVFEEPEESPEETYERVRLFALNLALSGSSREEVALDLRDKFDVADASEILDAVFPHTSPAREPKRRFGRRRRGS